MGHFGPYERVLENPDDRNFYVGIKDIVRFYFCHEIVWN